MTESIYKFFSDKDLSFDALFNNYLYFNTYKNFNDPVEEKYVHYAIDKNIDSNEEELMIKIFNSYLYNKNTTLKTTESEKKIIIKACENMLDDYVNQEINQVKLCCFCDGSQSKNSWDNKLLWSHYANGMKGFCIEFDAVKLYKNYTEKYGEDNISCAKVVYHENLKKIKSHEIIIDTIKTTYIKDYISENSTGGIFNRKSAEWEYENEFRITSKITENKLKYDPSVIKSIIVGEKISHENYDNIVKFAKKENIKIRKVIVCDHTFKIKIS